LSSESRQFIIKKVRTAYLVTVLKNEVEVEPYHDSMHTSATATIAKSMQLVSTAKLQLHQPENPLLFLINVFLAKGWDIENSA
jgi:hypothetical protein